LKSFIENSIEYKVEEALGSPRRAMQLNEKVRIASCGFFVIRTLHQLTHPMENLWGPAHQKDNDIHPDMPLRRKPFSAHC
jgi:hypothetical protein